MILCVYSEEPQFPATEQQPGALRTQIGAYWVDYLDAEPTPQEVEDLVNPPRRRQREIGDIYDDVASLPVPKQLAIWGDLSGGNPPKWRRGASENKKAIWSVAAIPQTVPAASADARATMIALYVQDNPGYLVNPPFEPSLNIPGDEPE